MALMRVFQKIKNVIVSLKLRQILLLALVLRVLWYLLILFTNPDGFWMYDSYGYWNIAYNVKEYGVFSRDEIEPLIPDCFRTPLYPLFILPTIFFDLNGYTIPLTQIILDCVTCWLIYKIVMTISTKENYAKLAAFVYAIHIPAIVMSNFVLTESLFAFLLTLFAFVFIKLIGNFGYKNILLLGFTGGLCVMCKPVAFVLIFPTILFILVLRKINFNTVVAVVLLSITFYAVQYPWMQRNKNIYGNYFNSVLGEYMLVDYHASNIYAKSNNITFNQAQEILRDKLITKVDYNPYKHPYEYAKFIERESYKIFLENKWLFLKEHTKECVKFFIQPMNGFIQWQLGKNHSYTKAITISFIVIQLLSNASIYLIILYGMFLFLRKQIKFTWFMSFSLLILFIFSQFNAMPFTDARLRFPLDPLLIVLGVLCLVTSKSANRMKT